MAEKKLTWENNSATFNGKIIGWIITDVKDAKYRMVFCPGGTPQESNASSEQSAREWIETMFNRPAAAQEKGKG